MDWLINFFADYPYLGVCAIFLLCGVGLPIPDEVVLVCAGYMVFLAPDPQYADVSYGTMVAVCFTSILAGDLIPFTMGRFFGPRLLRLRFLRFIVTRQRLAMFDRWFRRRGDLVIFFARFVPGLRVVTYFTAGTMRMRWARFLVLDMAGILLITPALVWVGWACGDVIDLAVTRVKTAERWILYTSIAAAAIASGWYWLRRRRRRRLLVEGRREAYVEPRARSKPKPDAAPVDQAPAHEATEEPAAGNGTGAAAPQAAPPDPPGGPSFKEAEDAAHDAPHDAPHGTAHGTAHDTAREDDDRENLTPSRN